MQLPLLPPRTLVLSSKAIMRPLCLSDDRRLVDAVLRAKLAFRTSAAHGCQPAAAGRFWAVFGLLKGLLCSPSCTGRPDVLALLTPSPPLSSLALAKGDKVPILRLLTTYPRLQK